MEIEARDALPAPSNDAIENVEITLKSKLPQDYLDLLEVMNGAYIQGNIFDIPGGNNAGVSQFVPFDKVLYQKSLVEQSGPKMFLPIAHASGGNYICLSLKQHEFGSVYFFDHEVPSNDALTKLASSLSAFLELLRPFTTSDVKLEPGQVKRIWIDPEFLKELKNKS